MNEEQTVESFAAYLQYHKAKTELQQRSTRKLLGDSNLSLEKARIDRGRSRMKSADYLM